MMDIDEPLTPEILPLGADGVLVRFSTRLSDAANRAVLALADMLDTTMPDGVAEISTTLSSVYLRFDPDKTSRANLIAQLDPVLKSHDWAALPKAGARRRWTIPVAFGDGHAPQLAETAALLGKTVDQTIADLVAHPVRVLAIGFAPGQPYLGMLPARWDIPRLQSITPQVPAGALVTAVRQLIVFTADTPTGWRHIGQTAFRPFRPDDPQPFPLLPGDLVTFTPVSSDDFDRIRKSDDGGARLEVQR